MGTFSSIKWINTIHTHYSHTIESGVLCRCPREQTGVYKDTSSNRCVRAISIVEVTLETANQWQPEYSNMSDPKTIGFTHNTETALYTSLWPLVDNLKGVDVKELIKGSVKLVVHLFFSAHPPPTNIGSLLQTAINNNQIPALNIKPNSIVTSKSFNGCNMNGPGTPCGVHGTCTPSERLEYTCSCKPRYKVERGTCVEDDELVLKVALPVVLILLLVVFVLLLIKRYRQRHNHGQTTHHENGMEMGTKNKSFDQVGA